MCQAGSTYFDVENSTLYAGPPVPGWPLPPKGRLGWLKKPLPLCGTPPWGSFGSRGPSSWLKRSMPPKHAAPERLSTASARRSAPITDPEAELLFDRRFQRTTTSAHHESVAVLQIVRCNCPRPRAVLCTGALPLASASCSASSSRRTSSPGRPRALQPRPLLRTRWPPLTEVLQQLVRTPTFATSQSCQLRRAAQRMVTGRGRSWRWGAGAGGAAEAGGEGTAMPRGRGETIRRLPHRRRRRLHHQTQR